MYKRTIREQWGGRKENYFTKHCYHRNFLIFLQPNKKKQNKNIYILSESIREKERKLPNKKNNMDLLLKGKNVCKYSIKSDISFHSATRYQISQQ